MENNFTDVLILVQLVVIVIMSVFVYRSYPVGKIEELFDKAEKLANATNTNVDDITLTVARYLHNLVLTTQIEEEDADENAEGSKPSE